MCVEKSVPRNGGRTSTHVKWGQGRLQVVGGHSFICTPNECKDEDNPRNPQSTIAYEGHRGRKIRRSQKVVIAEQVKNKYSVYYFAIGHA